MTAQSLERSKRRGVLALDTDPVRELDAREARVWLERLGPDSGTTRLREIPGRTTYVRELDGRRLVCKLTSRDSLLRRLVAPLRAESRRSPARREFEALSGLREAGIRAPRPALWVDGEDGASLVAMEHVEHSEDLVQRLERSAAPERRALLDRLARRVAALHAAGFYHRDLYLTHVLVEEGTGELVLVDAGRVRRERRPRSRWFVKDLAALHHSRPEVCSRSEGLRFLATYLAVRGARSDARARRRLARRVLAKSSRIAAHRPRHEDPATFRPEPRADRVLST